MTYNLGHEVLEVKDRSKAGVVIEYKTPGGEREDAHFDDLILAVGEWMTMRHARLQLKD